MILIEDIIGTNFMYFAIDEEIDNFGRYIANLVIAVRKSEPHLIGSKRLEKPNNVTIARFLIY